MLRWPTVSADSTGDRPEALNDKQAAIGSQPTVMRVEDALLYLVIDADACERLDLCVCCADAIAAGVDIIQFGAGIQTRVLGEAVAVCRRDDALAVVVDDAALAAEIGAAGVHLSSSDLSVGLARALLGGEGLVGLSTHSLEGVQLAAELAADYVLHFADAGCSMATFAGCRDLAGLPIYAGGVQSPADAATLVEQGVYRIGVTVPGGVDGEVGDYFLAFSRVLGRSF